MADMTFEGLEAVKVTAGRCVDFRKERNAEGGAVQVVLTMTGNMDDDTTRYRTIAIGPGWMRDHGLVIVTCLDCDGTGTVEEKDCPKCNGTGEVLDPQRAFEEKIFSKLADPPQSERDKVDTFLLANVEKKELKDLFEK